MAKFEIKNPAGISTIIEVSATDKDTSWKEYLVVVMGATPEGHLCGLRVPAIHPERLFGVVSFVHAMNLEREGTGIRPKTVVLALVPYLNAGYAEEVELASIAHIVKVSSLPEGLREPLYRGYLGIIDPSKVSLA